MSEAKQGLLRGPSSRYKKTGFGATAVRQGDGLCMGLGETLVELGATPGAAMKHSRLRAGNLQGISPAVDRRK